MLDGGAEAAKENGVSREALEKQLEEIFGRIASKDQSKQGLQDLTAFRAAHPAVDIMPHVRQQSGFMQNYIIRHFGLAGNGNFSMSW